MTRKQTNTSLDRLKADVATTNSKSTKAPPTHDSFEQLAADHDKLRRELDALRANLGETVEKGRTELKSEIVRHPFRSVLSAFAFGVAATLILRR